MGNTTRFYARGGSFTPAQGVWGHNGSSFQPAQKVWAHNGSSWVGVYSVLSVASKSNASNTSSGASSSGTASASNGTMSGSGNIGSLSYSWANVGGDGSISINNAALQTPTFSRNFSGVSPEGSANVSGTWRCTMTDLQTGATVQDTISVSLTWQNTTPAFSGQTDTYPGPASGTASRPTGASTVTIYIIGGGGQGGSGQFMDGDHQYGGGGAQGGGRVVWTGSAASAYTYNAGGARTASSVDGIGTADRGESGYSADGADAPGGSLLGSASGGNVANNTGNAGSNGSGGNGGAGGAGQSVPSVGTYGAGGDGGSSFGGGTDGQQGVVVFVWSP